MKRFLGFLKTHAQRPWFLPLVCFLAFIDLFIVVLPTEGMIMTTSVMRPRRWFVTGFAVTTASALGAIALSLASREWGTPFVAWIAGADFLTSAKWISTQKWIGDYGFWAIFLTALGPFPQQPVVLVAAVAGMSIPEIFVGAWFGRIPKYLFFSYVAARGEKWLREEFAHHPSLNRFPKLRDALLRIVHDSSEGKGPGN
ncbi:MAG: VTT domain-containing protein [Bdellovibrionales bacterium]|nr:VTT domain-containing protein [Bdellovibrionales bacterium]